MLVFGITDFDQFFLIETFPTLLPLFTMLQLTPTVPNFYLLLIPPLEYSSKKLKTKAVP